MRFNILLFLQLDFSSKAAAGSGWELFFGEVSSYIAENCKNPRSPDSAPHFHPSNQGFVLGMASRSARNHGAVPLWCVTHEIS